MTTKNIDWKAARLSDDDAQRCQAALEESGYEPPVRNQSVSELLEQLEGEWEAAGMTEELPD